MEAHPPQLEKKRDDAAFERCREELQVLRDQASAGDIELAFSDESGFAQVHPNRSAWTPSGEQHCIEAPRGQRLNVMAALLSSGKVVHTHFWCNSTAELFLGFVAQVAKHATKPVVIVLDNASIHRAAAIQPALERLKQQGVVPIQAPRRGCRAVRRKPDEPGAARVPVKGRSCRRASCGRPPAESQRGVVPAAHRSAPSRRSAPGISALVPIG